MASISSSSPYREPSHAVTAEVVACSRCPIASRRLRPLPALLLFSVVFFVSGSAHAKDATTLVQIVVLLLFCVLLVVYVRRCGGRIDILNARVPLDVLFLAALVASTATNIVLWSEYSMLLWYGSQIATFASAILITRLIPYKQFMSSFANYVVLISGVTIVAWLLQGQLIQGAPFILHESDNFDYRSYGIFVYNALDPSRAYGPFREPGVLAAYTILAVLILAEDRTKYSLVRIVIVTAGLLVSASTAGYLSLVWLVPYVLLKRFKSNVPRRLTGLVIVASGFTLFQQLRLETLANLNPEVFSKVADPNISTTTRLYGGVLDLMISLQNPMGVGPHQLQNLISQYSIETGYAVDARTNTITTVFIMWGILCGVLYLVIVLRAAFRPQRSRLESILFGLVLLQTLAVQPHFGFLATQVLIVYWFCRSRNLVHLPADSHHQVGDFVGAKWRGI